MNKKIQEIIKLRLQENDYSKSISFEERNTIKDNLIKNLPIKNLKMPEDEIINTIFGKWKIIIKSKSNVPSAEKGYIEKRIEIIDLKNNFILADMALVHLCDKNWNALGMNNSNPIKNLYGLFFNNKSEALELYYKIKFLDLKTEEIQKIARDFFLNALSYGSVEYKEIKNKELPLEMIYKKLEKIIYKENKTLNINQTKKHSVGKPWIDIVNINTKDIREDSLYRNILYKKPKTQEEEDLEIKAIKEEYLKMTEENHQIMIDEVLKALVKKSLEYTKINNYNLYLSNSLYSYNKELKIIFNSYKTVEIEEPYEEDKETRLYINNKKTYPKNQNKIRIK